MRATCGLLLTMPALKEKNQRSSSFFSSSPRASTNTTMRDEWIALLFRAITFVMALMGTQVVISPNAFTGMFFD